MSYPDRCPACAAPRAGVQEKRVYFTCKTMIDFNTDKPRVRRSVQCCAAKIQAGQSGGQDAPGIQEAV